MESYSPFFQTLYDERSPTGHLGRGTHATILRAIVFEAPNLGRLATGADADFAIIWDEDHDTRVFQTIEAIYRAGFLASLLMIGGRKGTINAIVSEDIPVPHVPEDVSPSMLRELEGLLHDVAQEMEDDPWSCSLHRLASPNRGIIDDEDDKVRLYLANLKMLWRLGVRPHIDDHLRYKTRPRTPGADVLNRRTAEIIRSLPYTPDYLDAAEFGRLWQAAEEITLKEFEKGMILTEGASPQSLPPTEAPTIAAEHSQSPRRPSRPTFGGRSSRSLSSHGGSGAGLEGPRSGKLDT